MDGRHFDVVTEIWEVLEGHGFIFVVPDNVFHHEVGWKWLGAGKVAREIESWSAVVRRVCDVNRVSSA